MVIRTAIYVEMTQLPPTVDVPHKHYKQENLHPHTWVDILITSQLISERPDRVTSHKTVLSSIGPSVTNVLLSQDAIDPVRNVVGQYGKPYWSSVGNPMRFSVCRLWWRYAHRTIKRYRVTINCMVSTLHKV
jgi:hypothetical protein